MTGTVYVPTPALGREVVLREEGSDRQVWADTFTGLYHVPPPEMPPPATVLDLGANIGLTAAHYRALWPSADIVAVEMDPDCAELAEVNARGVAVKCFAVTGRGGWGWYETGGLAEGYTFVRGGNGQAAPSADGSMGADGRRIVSSYTLRQIIRRSFPDVRQVDFVKMDVEGAEWGILAHGAWAPLVKHLLLEVHPSPDCPDRDQDTIGLVTAAYIRLGELGFHVRTDHAAHPRALWAWR